jgi:hypothetical protein
MIFKIKIYAGQALFYSHPFEHHLPAQIKIYVCLYEYIHTHYVSQILLNITSLHVIHIILYESNTLYIGIILFKQMRLFGAQMFKINIHGG